MREDWPATAEGLSWRWTPPRSPAPCRSVLIRPNPDVRKLRLRHGGMIPGCTRTGEDVSWAMHSPHFDRMSRSLRYRAALGGCALAVFASQAQASSFAVRENSAEGVGTVFSGDVSAADS